MEHLQYQLVQQYLEKSLQPGSEVPKFFILEGIEYLNEESYLLKLLKNFLGEYVVSDFLRVKDFGSKLGKEHSIKIKTDTNASVYKELLSVYNYQDIGVRDINLWLQQSSFSGKKIILLENIERMTISAINAFLKTAEEPMEGKLIVATTKNKSILLDTVLSRALVMNVSSQLSNQKILKKMDQLEIFENNNLKTNVSILSLGNWHRVEQFVEFLSENANIIPYFEDIDTMFSCSGNLYKKHLFLKQLSDAGLVVFFVEGLIAWYVEYGKWEIAKKWLSVKKLLMGSVNTNQVLFYALVQLDS